MKTFKPTPTLWALLLLLALMLTLPGCISSKPSKRDLQLQHYADSLTASRASKISDRQAAIAAVDMLNACECALTDTTQVLQRTREKAKTDARLAQTGGLITGSLGITIIYLIINLFK
ncbi:hypothetical protein [Runella sp.]|uniref:hypothetical protein n=1 Tax=Runella sp. TaxID=1960881 RepID=UPI003D1104D8